VIAAIEGKEETLRVSLDEDMYVTDVERSGRTEIETQ
jgi:hypothetical protein